MESFRNFVAEATNSNFGGGAVPDVSLAGGDLSNTLKEYGNKLTNLTNQVASKAQGLVTNDDNMKSLLLLLIPVALFVILSPGLLLNIPMNSVKHCADLIPLPRDIAGECVDGVFIRTSLTNETHVDNICIARQKCHKFGASGYTSITSVFVHAFVFVVIVYGVQMMLNR